MSDVESILELCYNSIDVNIEDSSYQDHTPLIYASFYGYPELTGLLLQHPRIDVNKQSNGSNGVMDALSYASFYGHYKIVKLLLQHPQIDVNKIRPASGSTALHTASSMGFTEIVRLLLQHPRIDVNKVNHDGVTALWEASRGLTGRFASEEAVELLLLHPEIDVLKGLTMNDTDDFDKFRKL